LTVKSARELCRDSEGIRALLHDDGAIRCCSLDSEGSEKCCFTSGPGEETAYWSFLDYLVGEGYSMKEIEVGEVKPSAPCPVCEKLKSLREMGL
jgi:hypothetical protein